jgi:hypothetical protein
MKLLCLQIDKNLTWANHTYKLITKLTGACYGFRSVLYQQQQHLHLNQFILPFFTS